jgi:hypothetical protein
MLFLELPFPQVFHEGRFGIFVRSSAIQTQFSVKISLNCSELKHNHLKLNLSIPGEPSLLPARCHQLVCVSCSPSSQTLAYT